MTAAPSPWQILAAAGLLLGAGVLHFVYAPLHRQEARGPSQPPSKRPKDFTFQ